jgi:hypothetical protein
MFKELSLDQIRETVKRGLLLGRVADKAPRSSAAPVLGRRPVAAPEILITEDEVADQLPALGR